MHRGPMTIAQKGRIAPTKNASAQDLKPCSLVMRERQLWDLVGEHGITDKETLRFAMNTVYQVAELILEEGHHEHWVLRVELLLQLSNDKRYQKLIGTILEAIRTGDRRAVLAAQLTALCAVLMMSPKQHFWPREWDSPTYKANSVWRPQKEQVLALPTISQARLGRKRSERSA